MKKTLTAQLKHAIREAEGGDKLPALLLSDTIHRFESLGGILSREDERLWERLTVVCQRI